MKNINVIFKFIILIGLSLLLTISCQKEDEKGKEDNNPDQISTTVKDIDGNVYHTVIIGSQVWMVENLKTTKYRNGDPIPNVTTEGGWLNLSSGGYCDYDNAPNSVYGKLYNWYAVHDIRNIAPVGWHIPSDVEWSTLTNYLGGESIAGGKLKEIGTTNWKIPNTNATNLSGFTALPCGFRGCGGTPSFGGIGFSCYFWTSTMIGTNDAWARRLSYDSSNIFKKDGSETYSNFGLRAGCSVRCIKD